VAFNPAAVAAELAEENHASSTFFVSNRVPKSQSKSEESFTHRRAGYVSYGEINGAGDGDPTCTAKSPDQFWTRLEHAVSAYPKKPVVVYIHGYRCTMAYSAKVAWRMQSSLNCPLILFSWPSRPNPFAYPTDECTAEWSSFQLASVLKDLGNRFGYENIVLVGHSMGCRMICWALQQCKASGESLRPKLRQVIFCAPDIDSLVFEQYSPLLANCASDTHIFASKKDVRLGISQFVHGSSRLGLVNDAEGKTEEALHDQATIHFIDYTKKDGFWGHSIPFGLLSQIFIHSNPQSTLVTSAPGVLAERNAERNEGARSAKRAAEAAESSGSAGPEEGAGALTRYAPNAVPATP
jgi:esterase/lipase superfamily enzyme